MASPDANIDIAAVVFDIQSSKYAWAAAFVLLVWDMVLTFDLEVERVWKTKASLGRNLFFINRYLSPLLFTMDYFSQIYAKPSVDVLSRVSFELENSHPTQTLIACSVVLVWRTYALYQRKILLWVLLFLAFSSTSTMIIVTTYNYVKLLIWLPGGSLPGISGCLSDRTSDVVRTTLIIFWIPFFILETSVKRGARTRFVSIIYRDGLIYYAGTCLLINLLLWVAAPISLSTVASALMRSLQVTIASRILLNIRGMLGHSETESTTLGIAEELEFRSNETEMTTIEVTEPHEADSHLR
ncbi:hypothetical protein BKA70DRAFT_1338199 [Coprinopsis sp. MPI-PUGE-AT-0042]|nr:hypothetical protein BKA70DRAFT_1338199 [Coprinopsis sp. MPI-PUGE-AT-0042]